MGLIDMHCHLLFGVDDGPKEIAESIKMLDVASEQGISHMILTPHYRYGRFPYYVETIRENFAKIKPEADARGIQIYLGCEYRVNSYMIEYMESLRTLPLAGSEYVLCEYSKETEASYIEEHTEELLSYGYIPVIAHVERYACSQDIEFLQELQKSGAMIQVNADAVLGIDGRGVKNLCKKALKNGCVDMIASDSHGSEYRRNHLGDCYQEVSKHYGEAVAQRLFIENPGKILDI